MIRLEDLSEILNSWCVAGLIYCSAIVVPDMREQNVAEMYRVFHKVTKDTSRIEAEGAACRRSTAEMFQGGHLVVTDVDCCNTNGVLRCYVDKRRVRF
jgi:hypothetical protein